MAIPRVVHQTARSMGDLPDDVRRNYEANMALNPGWEFRFHDDAAMLSYLQRHLPAGAFDLCGRVNPAYRVILADLFRYLVVHREGGVYLDVKTRLAAPLDSILRSDDCFILSQWRNGPGEKYEGWGIYPELSRLKRGEFQQWHVMAAPGHPFLERVIAQVLANMEDYSPAWHGTGKMGILRVSGPICYTLAIGPIMQRHPFRLIDAELSGLHYSCLPQPLAHMHRPGHYSQVNQPVMLAAASAPLPEMTRPAARVSAPPDDRQGA